MSRICTDPAELKRGFLPSKSSPKSVFVSFWTRTQRVIASRPMHCVNFRMNAHGCSRHGFQFDKALARLTARASRTVGSLMEARHEQALPYTAACMLGVALRTNG